MGVYNLSLKAVGGTITILGSAAWVDGSSSEPINILDGDGLNIQVSKTSPIDGFTIDPNGNSVDIIIQD